LLHNDRFFIFADLAAASLSQNGGASQEGKQAENYRMFHISSPFDLKAGKGLGESECADIENVRLAESCKIFLAANISWRKGMEFSLQAAASFQLNQAMQDCYTGAVSRA